MSRGGEGSKTTLLRVIRNEQNGGWLSRATETMMGNRDRFLREADSGGGWHPVAPVHSLFRQYIYILLTCRRRRRRRINTFNVRVMIRIVLFCCCCFKSAPLFENRPIVCGTETIGDAAD